ncbi:coiled-coil domain-containing protein 39 [Amyelois transitella]|uniref:coiled-coil domain-containing protein 39 n=1 Tax=Amyelois transitella TaxID=680683 RepID=UPI00298FE6DC|nr:coiled-coil domain-containing protein 39 [Amyelois transitella]
MSEKSKVPGYMAHLLEELGWNQGTRIPLANSDNQELETLLITRQNEIQQLKEALILQNQKREDLNKYKDYVHSEYQENTRLLFAHKQQLEQEVKLKQLACNEADRLDRDIIDNHKQSKDINSRIERAQVSIGRLLKKADSLKSEVCGERGALQEWRAALERSAGDITAIEQFTKQDLSKAKALETKRQKLKVEHDRMHDRLSELVSNLSAEERACERISVQVMEGMEQRKQMMQMWTNAVENLRQRDTDIRHIREDYAVLEAEANKMAEECREQQAFCDQQRGNNNDAQRENMAIAQRLSNVRLSYQQLLDVNATLHSEVACLQRELSNMRNTLEKLHMENRQIMEEQHRKDVALQGLAAKIKDLKEKLKDSTDKTKSSEKRAKELEDMLNEEEKYASQLTVSQQRAMHCSFVEQQKFLTLKNEEKLFHMQLKASKAVMSKLETKQRLVERNLQSQKESLYAICYQLETLGARVMHMEGAKAERECSAELLERENRLKDVSARHAARVALLERHAARLLDDMRRLTRELEARSLDHSRLQSRLKSSILGVEGGEKDLRASRDIWRRTRVEEALMRLKVAHAARALAGLDDTAFSLDSQRLQLDAAMNERLVEIAARRDMFSVQKRALIEDCGKLRSEIREREQRIDQLKKRYEIFIGSLGKDESGQQLSVTFFKIKFAAERAELRTRGAALDGDITRRERDVAALEATLRVVHSAHQHFMRHLAPLQHDTPEIEELNELSKQYYVARDELKKQNAEIEALDQLVSDTRSRRTMLVDKRKQLEARHAEAENELESVRERLTRQECQLSNARDIVKHNARRARKLVEGVDEWRFFQMSVWVRDYAEAAYNALSNLDQICESPELHIRLAVLLSSTDLQRHVATHQRRLLMFIERIANDSTDRRAKSIRVEESIFSTSSESVHSGMSVASGYTKRLSAFRKTLAEKVGEDSLADEPAEHARKSAISMRVVTLGFEEPQEKCGPRRCSMQSQRSLK